jgi:hypothetical protein
MTATAIAANFRQALDVHCALTAQVAFNDVMMFHYLADARDLIIRQIADASIRTDFSRRKDFI